MNLDVRVGNQAINFREDGTKSVRVNVGTQVYNISGQEVVSFRARDSRGNVSRLSLTYSFLGDGSVDLNADSGGTASLTLIQLNSRVTAMNLVYGEGQTEITLGIR